MENFTEDQKSNICKSLISHKFKPDENIINEGEEGSSFYIIKSGQVSVLKGKKVLVRADLNVPPDVSFSPIYLFSPPWFGTLASNVSSWTPKECRIFWGDGTSTSMLKRRTMLGIMPSGKR